MLYERHRREGAGGITVSFKAQTIVTASVTACAGEIDGTNQRDRYQKNQGTQEGEDDHSSLLTI